MLIFQDKYTAKVYYGKKLKTHFYIERTYSKNSKVGDFLNIMPDGRPNHPEAKQPTLENEFTVPKNDGYLSS